MKILLKIFLLFSFTFSFAQVKKEKNNPKKVEITKSETDTSKVRIINSKNDIYPVINDRPVISSDPYDDITIDISPSIKNVEENENTIYNSAGIELKPEFPGGFSKMFEFIKTNFKTPINEDGEKIVGKIFVSFTVEKDGSLSDIKVIRDFGYETDKEAIRVVKKMPKWIPGQQNNKIVRCNYLFPINVDGK